MAQRAGFKNIQIQAKSELYDLFDDTMAQSGANSKAEFLRILVDNYLNPEETNTPDLRKAEENLRVSEESLRIAIEEQNNLAARLTLYETEEMKAILSKHKGKTLVFTNSGGQKMTIEILDLPDVFSAIFHSVKIK
jgi:hypothetical protein